MCKMYLNWNYIVKAYILVKNAKRYKQFKNVPPMPKEKIPQVRIVFLFIAYSALKGTPYQMVFSR